MANLPDYLAGRVRAPEADGPAALLMDDQWCGHGEPTYEVFDIWNESEVVFRLRLPVSDYESLSPPLVLVESEPGATFPVYDSREHPSSIYCTDEWRAAEPRLQPYGHCPECGKEKFRVSVGFEIPSDTSGPNDTSWFVLALRCANCGWQEIVYDDETA